MSTIWFSVRSNTVSEVRVDRGDTSTGGADALPPSCAAALPGLSRLWGVCSSNYPVNLRMGRGALLPVVQCWRAWQQSCKKEQQEIKPTAELQRMDIFALLKHITECGVDCGCVAVSTLAIFLANVNEYLSSSTVCGLSGQSSRTLHQRPARTSFALRRRSLRSTN